MIGTLVKVFVGVLCIAGIFAVMEVLTYLILDVVEEFWGDHHAGKHK